MISRKILFLCLIAFNLVTAQNEDFSLSGKTSDFEDGTYLYLWDLTNGGNIDSALVRNNSFRFTTDLPEPTLYVMLSTKDRTKFVELWLENNSMTFDASNVAFKEGKVTGSRNHFLFEKIKEELYGDAQKTDEDKVLWEQEFIKNHPDALVSAYILVIGKKRWKQNEVGDAFSSLSREVQNSSQGKKITDYLEIDLPEVGQQYFSFSIPNSRGETVKFSDLAAKGKLTLLQFWSSGCGFSRTMNSNPLSELFTKYSSEGFEVITVSSDSDREKWLQAVKEDELSWPKHNNLNSFDGEVFKTYGIYATPSNFLIDRDGIIIARNLRGDELERKVEEELLNNN